MPPTPHLGPRGSENLVFLRMLLHLGSPGVLKPYVFAYFPVFSRIFDVFSGISRIWHIWTPTGELKYRLFSYFLIFGCEGLYFGCAGAILGCTGAVFGRTGAVFGYTRAACWL